MVVTIDDGDDVMMEDLTASVATIMVNNTQPPMEDHLLDYVQNFGTVTDVAHDGNCGCHALIATMGTTNKQF